VLNILPNFSMSELALMIFIMPVAVGWWANWYPGAEPGGGSYIAQRMLASKSEKDSLGAVLFFNLAHYVLRPWPWIITALCSIIIYPDLKSIQLSFPNADPSKIGHDSAFPAMLHFLPAGFVGLMVGGLIAANSSTILTHLNWGSSYLIHDFYRRFVNKTAGEKHYVNAGRLCTVALYIVAALLSLKLDSAQEAFQVLLSIGAGTGLLYLLRWFWWRINAWCEVVAMASSLVITLVFFVLGKSGHHYPFAPTLLIEVAFTTLCWLVTAFISPGTSDEQLIAFYKKVHPAGPGWTKIRLLAGVSETDAALHGDHMGMAFVGWISGCIVIWSSLFAIGNFLYGRYTCAFELTAVFVVSGVTLLWVINHLWDKTPAREIVAEPMPI
jgi:Na+/proline symporter